MAKENGAHLLAMDCIYQALVQLMEIKPYKDITITDITKKAGVSRMAYYRNFQEKDDILIDHLKKVLREAESHINAKSDFTKREFWREAIRQGQNDPINELIFKAGLFDKSFGIQLDFITRIYKTFYSQDELNESDTILLYRKLGSLYGCMFYLIDHKESMSTDTFVEHLIALAEKDTEV